MPTLHYRIEMVGFEAVSHKKTFHRKWLAEGSAWLMKEARRLIRGERKSNRYSGQPKHGRPPQKMPGWKHVGCLGSWRRGNPHYADCHCLEVFQDPNGKFFLVDQSEHGDFSGHSYSATVIQEVPVK